MQLRQRRYPKEVIYERAKKIYDEKVIPHVSAEDKGKYACVDIESGDFEIDPNAVLASDRIWSRHPDAQPCLFRIGHKSTFDRYGRGPRSR